MYKHLTFFFNSTRVKSCVVIVLLFVVLKRVGLQRSSFWRFTAQLQELHLGTSGILLSVENCRLKKGKLFKIRKQVTKLTRPGQVV